MAINRGLAGSSDHQSSSSGDESSGQSSTIAGSISGGVEDWLQAIGQPGKYMDGGISDTFRGSTGGGTCNATIQGNGPIYLTPCHSDFKMRNAMSMLHQY